MVINMMEIKLTAKEKVMEYTLMPTIIFTMVNGLMIEDQERDIISVLRIHGTVLMSIMVSG